MGNALTMIRCTPRTSASEESVEACLDQAPAPKAFLVSAISLEGRTSTGELTKVYFSVKNVAGPDVEFGMKFLAVFSKQGEVVKTARFSRFYNRGPLRRGEVEQLNWDGSVGGFCSANTGTCGSVTIRVVGVCYADPRGPKGK